MTERKRPTRNQETESGRNFWADVEQVAAGVEAWPEWKKMGLNVEQPGIVCSGKPEEPAK